MSVDAAEMREAPSSAFSYSFLPQGQLATVTDTPLHFFSNHFEQHASLRVSFI
jgi:hypothetical protein